MSEPEPLRLEIAPGSPRNFLNHRFVSLVLSARARGLSVGLNCHPDRDGASDGGAGDVNHPGPAGDEVLDVKVLAEELGQTLEACRAGTFRQLPLYRNLPPELLRLQHVTLSGDGEPTLNPRFEEVVENVMHLRALGRFGFFKIVLLTNGSGLDRPGVREGLRLFTRHDEIWVRLDASTQGCLDRANLSPVPLPRTLENLLELGRQRPIVIQSLFTERDGCAPPPEEIEQFAQRLLALKNGGAQISQVQIYSASGPAGPGSGGHLPLRTLSRIAQTVRSVAGLPAEVF